MTYDEQIKAIEIDLEGKKHRRDWHGVMDCAADLRELEAKERGRQQGYAEWTLDNGPFYTNHSASDE